MITAAIFIIGEMSGTGVLSLAKAMEQSNWTGLFLIIASCILSGYCGIRYLIKILLNLKFQSCQRFMKMCKFLQ